MIADAIKQAQRAHRAVIEQAYSDECTVFVKRPIKDPQTKATSHKEVPYLTGIDCHLSYSGTGATVVSDTVATIPQTIKLFLAPEHVIQPGSRIEVVSQGRTENYGQSGKAAVYSSHQEITLELWKDRA